MFHNVAVLNLNGGDGDDLFTVRAFALKGSTDSERARTDMKGDGGADTILYVVNAPVGIDGGDGFDTVRIIGTEFGDDFVVTDTGVFGAGLNVSYVNIEKLVADGAEGDDRFFVLSTGLDVVTEIDGGLGSDTLLRRRQPVARAGPVISNDFRGHSGIILHSVEESSDPAWVGVPIEGLSANVGDNEEELHHRHRERRQLAGCRGRSSGQRPGLGVRHLQYPPDRARQPERCGSRSFRPACRPRTRPRDSRTWNSSPITGKHPGRRYGASLGFNALTGACRYTSAGHSTPATGTSCSTSASRPPTMPPAKAGGSCSSTTP